MRLGLRNPRRPHRLARRRGFTLIEVALAVVIVGVGIVATQAMIASSTRVTAATDELQTATMLARAMHERCLNLDRAELIALDDLEYKPPLDSQGRALAELKTYSQRIAVQSVDPTKLTQTTSDPETGLLRIVVTVSRNANPILSSSRLLATTKQD